MIKTNLAVLMAERGLKIADVYEATGISKTTLMAISENTGKGIQYETVDKLCNFLEVSPSDFFVYSPYIFNISKPIFGEAIGGSEYINNILCNIKKGESETNFDIGVYFSDGENPSFSGDMLGDYYKDTSNYDLIVIFLFQNDNISFLNFYNSLQTQFKTAVKYQLLSAVINQINLGKVKSVDSFDTKKKRGITRSLNSVMANKTMLNALFAFRDDTLDSNHDCSSVYVDKTLKIKDEKVSLK